MFGQLRARAHVTTLGLAALSACGGPAHRVESGAITSDAGTSTFDAQTELSGPDSGGDADHARAAEAGPSRLDGSQAAGDGAHGSDAGGVSTGRDAALGRDGSPALAASDAGARDAATRARCPYPFEPVYEACLAAPRLTLGAPLAAQNSASGARGDCAVHASGPGGRNLYYRLTLPAGRDTRVVIAPLDEQSSALLRVLADCHVEAAESGARGTSGGRVEHCVHNPSSSEREVVLAVGHYSGESNDLTLSFDLTTEVLPVGQSCSW